MNYPNMVTIFSTLIIAFVFFCGVFINLDVKRSKEELTQIEDDIEKLKLDIKREKIEIAELLNPHKVLDYIEKNDYKPVSLNNIKVIYLQKE